MRKVSSILTKSVLKSVIMAALIASPYETGCFPHSDDLLTLTGVSSVTITNQQQQEQQQQDHCGQFVLAQSFKQLLLMYREQMAGVSGGVDHDIGLSNSLDRPPVIVAGGLQQYLIKNMKKNSLDSTDKTQPRKGEGSDHATFYDLPDSAFLVIFSYLSIRDVCRASCVSRRWYCVASDSLHWQQRLDTDIKHWNILSHTTYPDIYRQKSDADKDSDWTNKEIYLRCSPEVNQVLKQTYLSFHPLTSILRAFWPKKTPRLVMFGPGLESDTSRIARNILEDNSGVFKTTGMFPGQFEGMGSGFTIKMSGVSFHLVTLYTSTRQERESRPRDQRLENSRLLQHAKAGNNHPTQNDGTDADDDDDDDDEYEVRKAVQDLCATVDGFIFVIDAGLNPDTVSSARSELRAMVNKRWVAAGVPLVVMSCRVDSAKPGIPCIDVVKQLGLPRLSRPWQVRDCEVGNMSGVTDCIQWVVEQAQRS